jgi:hypothetical protein
MKRTAQSTVIEDSLASVNLTRPATVTRAAARILAEDLDIKVGDRCASLNDDIQPIFGEVKVTEITNGIATVRADNGAEYKVLGIMLAPLKAGEAKA